MGALPTVVAHCGEGRVSLNEVGRVRGCKSHCVDHFASLA